MTPFPSLTEPVLRMRGFRACLHWHDPRRLPEIGALVTVPEIALVELIPGEMWVAAEGVAPVRTGQYLVFNRWLTNALRLDVTNTKDQVVMVYDSLPDMLSGFHKQRGNYHYVKLPLLNGTDDVAQQMVLYAYLLRRHPELVVAQEQMIDHWIMTYPATLDEKMKEALEKLVDAADPRDVLGRHNPNRIPLMCFQVMRLVRESRLHIMQAELPAVERRLAVLANRYDQIVAKCRQVGLVAGNAIHSARTTDPGQVDWTRPPIEAEYLRQLAEELRVIVDRPIARAIAHTMRNLNCAADALDAQDLQLAVSELAVVDRVMHFQYTIAPLLLTLRLDLDRVMRFNIPNSSELLYKVFAEINAILELMQMRDYDQGLKGALIREPVQRSLSGALEYIQEGDLFSTHQAVKASMATV